MRVVWTRAALSDLGDIQDYVAEESPIAARRLALDIFERPQILSRTPLIGRTGRALGTRELVLADLPYIIVYRVTDQVEVLGIIHTAREWPGGFD